MNKPYISVVIPMKNEAISIPKLLPRLHKVLDDAKVLYELVCINDGSTDATQDLLQQYFQKRSDCIKIIQLQKNYGQHMAILAGMHHAEGDFVLTIDADLQNPPEEIPKILQCLDKGHDYVGSYRLKRHDHWFRTWASKCVNAVRERVTGVSMRDHGCMLRAYSKSIVQEIIKTNETSTMIPVLAHTFAYNPTEVGIQHHARKDDCSKYTPWSLMRLNFDLFTGFSLFPLQIFTVTGMVSSVLSMGWLMLRLVRYGLKTDYHHGHSAVLALMIFLVSFLLMGLGIVGEYVGRIYQLIRQRPKFIIHKIWKPCTTIDEN